MAGRDEEFWRPHLASGERLLWQGAPRASARLEWSGPLEGVISVALLIFALIVTAHFATAGGFWWLMPAVMLGVAGWYAVGIHYWRSFERARTRYALTTERALIARRRLGLDRLASYPITSDVPLDLVEAADGPGVADIHFVEEITFHDPDRQTWTRRAVGFEQIPGARGVLRLMHQVQAAATSGAEIAPGPMPTGKGAA